MKRLLILAIALGVISFTSINAIASVIENTAVVTTVADDGRTEIQYDELPDAVRTSFEGSDYAAWEVEKVEKVTADEAPEDITYEITVSDGTNSQAVAFDEEGNMVQ